VKKSAKPAEMPSASARTHSAAGARSREKEWRSTFGGGSTSSIIFRKLPAPNEIENKGHIGSGGRADFDCGAVMPRAQPGAKNGQAGRFAPRQTGGGGFGDGAFVTCPKWILSGPFGRSLGIATLLAMALGVRAAEPTPQEKIVLQLQGRTLYQQAGYFTAQAQGYFKEEGLDVDLKPARETGISLTSVLAGNATYGVGGAALLPARLNGAPVVVLAAILQQTPRPCWCAVTAACGRRPICAAAHRPRADAAVARIAAMLQKAGVTRPRPRPRFASRGATRVGGYGGCAGGGSHRYARRLQPAACPTRFLLPSNLGLDVSTVIAFHHGRRGERSTRPGPPRCAAPC